MAPHTRAQNGGRDRGRFEARGRPAEELHRSGAAARSCGRAYCGVAGERARPLPIPPCAHRTMSEEEIEERNAGTKLANEKKEAADRLEYCQTAAHALIRESIKNSLKDPRSFKEVGRNYYTNAIEIKYTATNGFGGRVTEAYRYHYEPDVCGTNSKVEKIN